MSETMQDPWYGKGLFAEPLELEVLKPLVERPTVMSLWGADHEVTPVLIGERFGDGRRLLRLCPIARRSECDHYVVQVDSSWSLHNHDVEPTLHDHLDEIYEAIREQCGEWTEDEDDEGPHEYEWPMLDLSVGCEWRPVYPEDLPKREVA